MSDAAKIVLSELNSPMHVKDIVTEIDKRDLFKFGAKNPAAVLSGTLNKKTDTFVRIASGTYCLKE